MRKNLDIMCFVCRSRMELLFHVTPSTGEHVHSKYVYIDLHFMLTQQVSFFKQAFLFT